MEANKLIIKRSEWYRGLGGSYMRRSVDGKKCPFGFLALSEVCKGTEGQITDLLSPHNALDVKWPEEIFDGKSSGGLVYHSQLALDIMNANDTPKIKDDQERETKLQELFVKLKLELEFVE